MLGAFTPGQVYPGQATVALGTAFDLAATLADVAPASAFTVAAPANRTFAVAAGIDDVTAGATFTAAAPADRTFTAAVTTGDVTEGSTFTAVAPANRTFAGAVSADDASVTSAFTTVAPPARTFAAAATLDDVTAASSFTKTSPVVVGPVTVVSTFTNDPPAQLFTVAAALDPVTASGAFRAVLPVVAGPVTAASAFTAAAPSVVTFATAGTLADTAPSSSFTATAPGNRTFAVSGTLADVAAVSGFTTSTPSNRTFAVAATAGDVAASSAFAAPAYASFTVDVTAPAPVTAASRFVTPTVDLPPDLLSAVIAYLKAEPTVAVPLTEGDVVKVFSEMAAARTNAPFLVVDRYKENTEGISLDDEPVELLVQIVSSGEDEARALGKLVKAAIDPPNFNPASLGREPFTFDGGEEYTCKPRRSQPEKRRGISRSNQYEYIEEIEYEFWVTPTS